MSSKAARAIKKASALAIVLALAAGLTAAATMPDGRETPTGLDVPRWISLKASRVRARHGPGLDHRILWEYRAAGLPVQVIAETREWRKICDPEGAVAWIHRSVASSRQTAFNPAPTELVLHRRPEDRTPARARLRGRSIIGLERCEGDWCRLRAGKIRGWVRREAVFGAQTAALCSANATAGATSAAVARP